VRLLWDSQNNRVCVTVDDERSGQLFWFEANPADVLEAFHHPYPFAYANRERAKRRAAAGAIETR
jgi:hypothetical protein